MTNKFYLFSTLLLFFFVLIFISSQNIILWSSNSNFLLCCFLRSVIILSDAFPRLFVKSHLLLLFKECLQIVHERGLMLIFRFSYRNLSLFIVFISAIDCFCPVIWPTLRPIIIEKTVTRRICVGSFTYTICLFDFKLTLTRGEIDCWKTCLRNFNRAFVILLCWCWYW